jgi:hypothetical protein
MALASKAVEHLAHLSMAAGCHCHTCDKVLHTSKRSMSQTADAMHVHT